MDFEPIGEALTEMSVELFGDRGYGPTPALWNMWRPRELPSAQTVVRAFVRKGAYASKDTWGPLLARVNLSYPPHGHLIRRAKIPAQRVALPDMDAPAPMLGEMPKQFYREGLPVMWSTRPVIVWDLRRHTYVTVGERRALEVR